MIEKTILDATVEATGTPLAAILGDSRITSIVDARHIVCLYLKAECGWTVKRIGDAIGRDHTSVMNLLNKRPITPNVRLGYHKAKRIANAVIEKEMNWDAAEPRIIDRIEAAMDQNPCRIGAKV